MPHIPPARALALWTVAALAAGAAHAGGYTQLYAFRGGADGVYPTGGLVAANGVLYGTTTVGGIYTQGTVFSITPGGHEKIMHIFGSGADGANPSASLTLVGNRLYGTTDQGGDYSVGTVFSLTLKGTEQVLHSFGSTNDGFYPLGSVLYDAGTLYGTASSGGTGNGGTVFALSLAGQYATLHNFVFETKDGFGPQAGLINVGGTFYGTVPSGGVRCGGAGCGVVYSITPKGHERIVYPFGPYRDANSPYSNLLAIGGTLYGTTEGGGVFGLGTVFAVTPGGREHVLHSFRGSGTDGANPFDTSGLVALNGKLYGTTSAGGAYNQGTVFQITRDGRVTILYSFGGGNDGADPIAGLAVLNGVLYGTTQNGGNGCTGGCGTVFAITP